MRTVLKAAVTLALLATACGGTHQSTTSGTTTGGNSTSGTTTGATTGGTSGGSPTGGTTSGGGLPAGSPCTSDALCNSNICGTLNHTGNCCSVPCNTTSALCGAIGCDTTGTCVYPVEDAGAIQCSGDCTGNMFSRKYCDTAGACSITTGQSQPCLGNFACNVTGDACDTTCTGLAQCAMGFTCVSGACIPQIGVGPCTDNDACLSLACGVSGGPGDCCSKACASTLDPACNATDCDATSGACIFPTGTACASPTCANSAAYTGGQCDSSGKCVTNPVACPNHLGCNPTATACNTSCKVLADCARGFYCDNDAGGCIPQTVHGPCLENDACTTQVCGIAGVGNCCNVACGSTSATCAAPDCDGTSGACLYPDAGVACGTTLESCSTGVQQNPSVCDAKGNCPTPGVTQCTPFICGANACLTTCTDATSCVTGAFCDTADSSCCAGGAAGLASGGTITVDGANGDDSTACCGFGSAVPCLTIGHAMKLIDNAQASNVTISASIKGGGGNWTPKGETYPILLGWGVELSAGNVYFYDPNGGNAEIFDIAKYSSNDTVGTASIVGTAKTQIWVGMNLGDTTQTTDTSAIQVESGSTLYLADATVNGSAASMTTAITVVGGGTLTLGQDSAAAVTGTVTIGNNAHKAATDGWTGIACTNNAGTGCTVSDAVLKGASSIVIEGQENVDIDAEDYATISLTSAPTIGLPPSAAGFQNCPAKPDGVSTFTSKSAAEAVLLNGKATMTFSNGTVQCISGDGFLLQATTNGVPKLTMSKTTIQNTEYAIDATAGSASVSGSTIEYNYNGVVQGTDGTNKSSIDLSGGTVGGVNSVVCSNSVESVLFANNSMTPAVCVLDTTSDNLDASNVDWDTTGPDEFSCNAALTSCTCDIMTCTNAGGVDGMDAVDTGTGTVTTANNGNSKANCSFPCGDSFFGHVQCKVGQICCEQYIGFPCCEADETACNNSCP